MKVKKLVFFMMLIILLLSGCSNSDDPTDTIDPMNELVADEDFMFNTTITVELQLQSTLDGNPYPNARFEIYNAFPYKDGKRLLTAKTDANGSFTYNLQIASHIDTLILFNENKDFYELEIDRIDLEEGIITASFESPYNSGTRAAPAWAFNTSPYYATIYSEVYDYQSDTYSDDTNDMFACFINNTCVGVTGGSFLGAELLPGGQVLFTNLAYFPNTEHHTLNFRFYDASEDQVYAFDYWYYFHHEDVQGSVQNPDIFYYDGTNPMPDPYILSMSFPAAGVYGTLAYEDMWPQQGDYDMNDFVLYGNFAVYLTDIENYSGYFEINYKLAALGAGYTIGFGIQLPDFFTLSNISSTTGTAEIEEDGFTVIFCDDARDILPGTGYINTDPDLPYIEPDINTVTFDFEENFYRMVVVPWYEPPFNPFIFINGDRSHEIHPADYPPTELVNPDLWLDDDDTSNPDEWRYYRTTNNLPWCFMLPIELAYPREKSTILEAYPYFDDWVNSPWDYEDWYLDEPGHRNYNYIYPIPD